MNKVFYYCCLCLFFFSCEQEPIGNSNINKDFLDEELVNLISRTTSIDGEDKIGCVRFNYPFVIFLFNESDQVEDFISIRNDQEFIALLGSLNNEQNISISYPIYATLSNGELIEITTNEQLRENIKSCAKEEILVRCNALLSNCVWIVTEATENAEIYLQTEFKQESTGSMRYFAESIYLGTWISLFIEDTLYLNIFTIGDETPNDFWNKNWEVITFTEEKFELKFEETLITIEKNCDFECPKQNFQTCEIEDGTGIGVFNLSKFRKCIGYSASIENPVDIFYYINEQDAINNINPISNPSNYENIVNEQVIYIKTWNKVTNDSIQTNKNSVILEAIPCN